MQVGRGEASVHHMVQQREQRAPIAVDVDHDHRLVVLFELAPGDDLQRLVERADTARQHQEGVREVEHALLADVHAVDDPKLHPGVRDLPPLEKIRNDADGAAAGAERGIGDDAHKTDPPATVDRSEEHTSELQSLMRISYAVFCLKKKTRKTITNETNKIQRIQTY